MKKFTSFLVAMILVVTCFTSLAEGIDLSGLSYADLVALKDRINLAMWQCDEWQEVTVPQGVWKVGEDIPAGHWTIKAADGAFVTISIGTVLEENGKTIDLWESSMAGTYYSESVTSSTSWVYDATNDLEFIDYELKNGMFVEIDNGSVIFTPYQGKPGLGFK